MRRVLLALAALAILFTLFFPGVVAAAPYTYVSLHGELYDPTTEGTGGWDVLTSQLGTEALPKTAIDIGAFSTREISAWTIASAEQGRLAFNVSSSIIVPPEAPQAQLSAFIQSINNRIIDEVNPLSGDSGLNEGDAARVLVQVRLDAIVQQQGRPSGSMSLAFTVRAGPAGTGGLPPIMVDYSTGGLNPPQAFEVHEEWDFLVDITVGELISYDALMSGWINGTAFDPGTSGTNFILIDPIMRVSNAPGYDLELVSAAGAPTTPLPMSNQFDDVMPWHWAYDFIETLADSGITAGCGSSNYCPEASVTRAQMAVFLERGINGSNYVPPPASGNVFNDVGAGDFAAAWIEQLLADAITAGCGNNNYCPNDSVTRAQMAVFLLRAKYGAGYSPPAATGVFTDVPLSHWAVHWIEQLAAEGITAGCGDDTYCPDAEVTRDQMAVFLVRTFAL